MRFFSELSFFFRTLSGAAGRSSSAPGGRGAGAGAGFGDSGAFFPRGAFCLSLLVRTSKTTKFACGFGFR